MATSPQCIVIPGPNGAGKTTFARTFLPRDAGIVHFVNADLIASGLSPLKPELASIAARVKQGGHTVPRTDVVRRFERGWHTLQTLYQAIATSWAVYDNAGEAPRLVERCP